MTGFHPRTNLPLDLQAAIPHLVDAGGSRGPQHDYFAQNLLEVVWKLGLAESMQRGWVRLSAATAAEEAPTDPPPTARAGGFVRRAARLLRRRWGRT